jgi:hypothetical protein
MKFQLLAAFLAAAFLPITQACLSMAVDWNPQTNDIIGAVMDNGENICNMNRKMDSDPVWFQCQNDHYAFVSKDLKLFAYAAHGQDFHMTPWHDHNLAGHEIRWYNYWECNCGGYFCEVS